MEPDNQLFVNIRLNHDQTTKQQVKKLTKAYKNLATNK